MEDDGLLTTRVPRALEMKSKLFGFELPDLIFIFLTLAMTNLLFGATKFRYLLVWGSTGGLAVLLYFAKKGKPDGYLQHLVEFWLKPSFLSAGGLDRFYRVFNRKDHKHERP
jgi:uncharacterized protein (DUF3820 family)